MATIRAAGRKIIVDACGESMLPNMLEFRLFQRCNKEYTYFLYLAVLRTLEHPGREPPHLMGFPRGVRLLPRIRHATPRPPRTGGGWWRTSTRAVERAAIVHKLRLILRSPNFFEVVDLVPSILYKKLGTGKSMGTVPITCTDSVPNFL
jgi:hypothetical protein